MKKRFLMFGLFALFLSMMASYAAPPQVMTTVDDGSGGYCFVQETIDASMDVMFDYQLMPAMAGEEVVIAPQFPRICNIRYARLKAIYLPIDLTGTSDPPGYNRWMNKWHSYTPLFK